MEVIVSEINWLHMSDIHYNFNDYETQRLRDDALKYLNFLNMKYDFIALTGDMAYKSGGYTEVKSFINELRNLLKIPGNIFLVPGNHDLKRSQEREIQILGLFAKANNSNIDLSTFVNDKLDSKTYHNLLKAFKGKCGFFQFYREITGKPYPEDALHFVEKRDLFNIIHLNTCLISGIDNEETKLVFNQRKFIKAIEGLKNEIKLNIVLGHHDLGCFSEKERILFENTLSDYQIDLFLSGHIHQSKYRYLADDINPCLELVSGAGMADENSIVGFITGKVDLVTGKGEAKFHKWGRNFKWAEDNEAVRKTRSARYSFELAKFASSQVENKMESANKATLNKMNVPVDKVHIVTQGSSERAIEKVWEKIVDIGKALEPLTRRLGSCHNLVNESFNKLYNNAKTELFDLESIQKPVRIYFPKALCNKIDKLLAMLKKIIINDMYGAHLLEKDILKGIQSNESEVFRKWKEADETYNKDFLVLEQDIEDEFRSLIRSNGSIKNTVTQNFDNITESKLKDEQLWEKTGRDLFALEKKDEALDAFNKVFKLKPKDSNTLENIAHVLFDLGRSDEALKAFELVKKLRSSENNDLPKINTFRLSQKEVNINEPVDIVWKVKNVVFPVKLIRIDKDGEYQWGDYFFSNKTETWKNPYIDSEFKLIVSNKNGSVYKKVFLKVNISGAKKNPGRVEAPNHNDEMQ